MIDQLDFGPLDIEFTSPTIWDCFQEKINSASNNCSSPTVEEHDKSAVATTQRWSSSCAIPGIVSFVNPGPLEDQRRENGDGGLKPKEAATAEIATGAPWHGQTKRARSRPLAPNQEHVFAERQRRTKITQKLIELAAIIPGLKKVRILFEHTLYLFGAFSIEGSAPHSTINHYFQKTWMAVMTLWDPSVLISF